MCRSSRRFATLILMCSVDLAACSRDARSRAVPSSPGQVLLTGPVLEQLDAPPYTYLRLKTATGEVWATVPITSVLDREKPVTIRSSGAFKNFYASPAQRRFELLHIGTLVPTPAKP